MPTFRKPSKKKVIEKPEKELQKVLDAIKSGGKLVEQSLSIFSSKMEYGIKYPQGGYFKITKRLFDKAKKSLNQ
jgi:hypothetical protein